uniref:non-specific serine/threonine protein kinase n=1 Tax=Salix viminalis TaxID=40686 RepID=A0A6N2LW45_SALVM
MGDFWTAKISDFGLAKLLVPDQTRTLTIARGTPGYMAPEWTKINTPTSVKVDVYSYGVVLLEIVFCRRNMEINVSKPEEILLSKWAYELLVERELERLDLGEDVDRQKLEKMVMIGIWCIQDEPDLRPSMKNVVMMSQTIAIFLYLFFSLHLLPSCMALESCLLLLILFLLFVETRTKQNQCGEIHLGSQLFPTSNLQSWTSPSGHFAFGFYPQGNGFAIGIWLIGQPDNTVVWTVNRDDPPVSSNATIHFSEKGELLLRTEKGYEKPIAGDLNVSDSASMLDSVIVIIWQSFDFPTDTILGGQSLTISHELVSSVSSSNHSSGRFFLAMQRDGNLVAYPRKSANLPSDAYWSNQTFTWSNLSLNHQGLLSMKSYISGPDVLVLANSSHSCENRTTIFRATLDAGGIFTLYSHCFESKTSWSVHTEWSALNNQCDVHGFCDFNSYCSGTGTNCECYPGFVFNDPNDKFSGCYRNASESFCADSEEGRQYNLTRIENLLFERDPYSAQELEEEKCRSSCLDDCQCDVALYMGEKCEKHTFPIRYGRKNKNISSTAFFKEETVPDQKIIIESKKSLIMFLAIIFSSIAILCFGIAISTFFVYRDRAFLYEKLSEIISLTGDFTLRSFSYDEIEKATNGFREELGRGSVGAVYKGKINGGDKTVAIKRLEKVLDQGEKNFQAEITIIGQTYHRNLVRLLGFCFDRSRRFLVYEYLKNGTLAEILFTAERRPVWKERMRIALDIARGILYLHEECEACIIHCNITPQNILMDDSGIAKISDFAVISGQDKKLHGLLSHSRGHLAPEWQSNAVISVKADIYSFGVVLLEIISCRSSIQADVSTEDEMILSRWASQCLVAGQLDMLVKDEHVEYESLERMVRIGLCCVQNDPSLRPAIKNVILMLEGSEDIPNPPSLALEIISP